MSEIKKIIDRIFFWYLFQTQLLHGHMQEQKDKKEDLFEDQRGKSLEWCRKGCLEHTLGDRLYLSRKKESYRKKHRRVKLEEKEKRSVFVR
jgi:hypothetical protein